MSQIEVKTDAERPEVQRTLFRVRAKLRESDAELAQLCKALPEPTEDFDAWAELRGTLECVRTDLLEDALATLRTAARRTKEEWHKGFQQRQVFEEALLEAEILSALDEVACEGIAAYVERVEKAVR